MTYLQEHPLLLTYGLSIDMHMLMTILGISILKGLLEVGLM
jgi:hypothetical protein